MYFFAEKTQKIIKSLKALTNKIFVHIFVVTDFTVTKTIPGKSAINWDGFFDKHQKKITLGSEYQQGKPDDVTPQYRLRGDSSSHLSFTSKPNTPLASRKKEAIPRKSKTPLKWNPTYEIHANIDHRGEP